MRMSDSTRARINEAAAANGRSVSQEIESRLEMSFQEERIIGSAKAALLTKLIAFPGAAPRG